jgi:hypothetical protein
MARDDEPQPDTAAARTATATRAAASPATEPHWRRTARQRLDQPTTPPKVPQSLPTPCASVTRARHLCPPAAVARQRSAAGRARQRQARAAHQARPDRHRRPALTPRRVRCSDSDEVHAARTISRPPTRRLIVCHRSCHAQPVGDDRITELKRVAERIHDGQLDQQGVAYIEHIRRVAGAVSESAKPVALFHDAIEDDRIAPDELRALLTNGRRVPGRVRADTRQAGRELLLVH